MPNIRTFENNVKAPTADQAGSEAYEQLGRHVEESYSLAGQAIGRGMSEIGQQISDHEDMTETLELSKQFAQLDAQTDQEVQQMKTSADPNDPQLYQKYMEQKQNTIDQLGANLDSEGGKRLYAEYANRYASTTLNKIASFQMAGAADQAKANLDDTATLKANSALTDPTMTGPLLSDMDALGTHLDKTWGPTVIQEKKLQIADSGVDGVIQNLVTKPGTTPAQIDAAKAYLSDPKNPFMANTSPGKLASAMSRLDSYKQSQGNVQSVIAAQTLTDGYKQIEQNGGVDPNNQYQGIINSYQAKTPEETAEFKAKNQRDYDAAVATGQAIRGAKSVPDADLTAAIVKLKAARDAAAPEDAQKAEATLNAAVTAQKTRDEAFKKDPAGWMTTDDNNELVQTRFAQFQQSPTPQNFQIYAAASTAEQARLYPNLTPKLIPDTMMQQIGGSIQKAMAGDQGPAAVGNVVAPLVQQMGSYWPQVAIQLRQDKVVSGNVGVGAELFGSPATQALGETILQAAALSPADLKDKFGIAPEKAMAPVNAALKPLIATMGNLPNADRLIADYRNAAVAAVQYTGDPSSAAGTIQRMLTNRYDIEDKTLRIPKSLGIDASRVGDGAQAVRSDIGSHQLVLPPGFAAMHITPDRYAAQLKSSGKWFTNENNTGALLYDMDGHNVQELKNGKPTDVELSWDELGKVADKQPLRAIDRSLAGFIGGQ